MKHSEQDNVCTNTHTHSLNLLSELLRMRYCLYRVGDYLFCHFGLCVHVHYLALCCAPMYADMLLLPFYCSSFISKVFIINSLNTFCCYCRCTSVCTPRHLIVDETHSRKIKSPYTHRPIHIATDYLLLFNVYVTTHFVAWIKCVRGAEWWCVHVAQATRARENNKIQSILL